MAATPWCRTERCRSAVQAPSAYLATIGPGTTTKNTQVSSGATLDLNSTNVSNRQITINGSGNGGIGALINSNTSGLAVIAGSSFASVGITTATGASSGTVTISGGGGSGAAATANLGVTAASFAINGGTTIYTGAPTVTISGGGGAGATATAILTGGTVSGVTITADGTNFSSAPTLAFSGGTVGTAGTNPTATGNATNFTINSITITNGGSGYTSAPTVNDGTAVFTTPAVAGVMLAGNSSIGGPGNIEIDSPISGGYGITKVGAGNLSLTAANTYTGGTSLIAGTLILANVRAARPWAAATSPSTAAP